MISIDTNVLLRFLLDDSPLEARRVERFLASLSRSGDRAFVSTLVIQEFVWALTAKKLHRSKADAREALDLVLRADLFEVEDAEAVRAASRDWEEGRAEFSDYLMGRVNEARGHGPTVTLERRRLRGCAAFRMLPG